MFLWNPVNQDMRTDQEEYIDFNTCTDMTGEYHTAQPAYSNVALRIGIFPKVEKDNVPQCRNIKVLSAASFRHLIGFETQGRRVAGMERGGGNDVKIKALYIYPIKACRGISVPHACVSPTGFKWDRQWLIVNSKGRMYTQRVEPKLALVEVSFPMEAFTEDWEPTTDKFMTVKAPGMEPLRIPLLQNKCERVDNVSIWEWSGSALDEGSNAANWFSTYLGKPSRLVRFDTVSEVRPIDADYARGYKTMFADEYPFLMASQGSLDLLNKHLSEPLPINRFRPNIFVEGCEPFAEDLWKTLRINGLTFHGVKLCARCKVPTVNQETGIAGNEPTETLSKYRSGEILSLERKLQKKVFFGQNLICEESLNLKSHVGKVIRVGDIVNVVKKISSAAEAAA